MKLFVWANPYSIPYGSTLAFAVAETVDAAREQLSKSAAWAYSEYSSENPGIKNTSVLKEPTRVLDLPCAEWHKWEE